MKNILLTSMIAATVHVSAQTILITNMTNTQSVQAVTPNQVISSSVKVNGTGTLVFDIKNTGSSVQSYNVKRYDIVLNSTSTETASAYFCVAGSCYGSGTFVSPTPLTLNGGQSASQIAGSYQTLSADLDEISVKGPSKVKYTIINTANSADSVQFTIEYNYTPPPPAISYFTLPFNFANVVAASPSMVDPTPTPTTAGVSFGNFKAVGPGNSPTTGGMFMFAGWPVGATNGNDVSSTMTGSIHLGTYYEITVTPASGYYVSLNFAKFDVTRSGDGPRNYSVRSSADNYGANLAAGVVNNTSLSVLSPNVYFWNSDATAGILSGSKTDLSAAAFKNFQSPITFRFYSWNAETGQGSFGIDNVEFDGLASITITGIGSLSHALHVPIKLYPNPSHDGYVTLETTTGPAKIQVVNSLGALIMSQDHTENSVNLNLTGLSSGIYYVKITDAAGSRTEKLILAR